jgi:hypothetical protein
LSEISRYEFNRLFEYYKKDLKDRNSDVRMKAVNWLSTLKELERINQEIYNHEENLKRKKKTL